MRARSMLVPHCVDKLFAYCFLAQRVIPVAVSMYLRGVVLVVFLLLLGACASSPDTRYYYLSSTSADSNQKKIALAGPLGIGPVSVAAYLNRPQITTSDGNQLNLAMFDHWAEPLNKAIERVLVDNITSRVDQSVYPFPWRQDAHIAYAVTIRIDQLDRVGDRALLKATWVVMDAWQPSSQERLLFQRHSDIMMTVDETDYENLAAVYSKMMVRLSDAIVYSLSSRIPEN